MDDLSSLMGDASVAGDGLSVELADEADATPTRDMVYETGGWVRYLWSEVLDEDPAIEGSVENRYPGTEWPQLVRELFGRLYGTATKLDEVRLGAEWAEPLHETADQLPEWAELEHECRGDEQIAAAAAVQIQQELELPDAPPANPMPLADKAAKAGAEGDKAGAKLAYACAVDRIEESREAAEQIRKADNASALRRRMRKAIHSALEDARETKAAVAMLGCGDEPSAEEKRAWRHRIQENPVLVHIAALAGRMEATLEGEHAQTRSELGKEDIVGLRLGGSIAESVPMERALFSHPVLGLLQAAKMSEHRLLQNRQVGLLDDEKVGSGPLIFACDESGSMHGYSGDSPNIVAKAIALTLARRCASEGRTFAWVHWSTSVKTSVYANGKGQNSGIADELSTFLNGGTDIPMALEACTQIVRGAQPEFPKSDAERADVIFITDARSHEHGATEKALEELSATGARVFCFHVDSGPEHETLREHSVRYMRVTGEELGDGTEIALTIHGDTEAR